MKLDGETLPISLNREKRRRELLRVSRENSTMIKRIMDRKPETNRESWTSSWSKNLLYLDNISKYSLDWTQGQVEIVRDLSFRRWIVLSLSAIQPTEHEQTVLVETLTECATKLPEKRARSNLYRCHRNKKIYSSRNTTLKQCFPSFSMICVKDLTDNNMPSF